MFRYLLLESRDGHEDRDVERFHQFALGLVRIGQHVTYFLVQNGVFQARATSPRSLRHLAHEGIHVLADTFSLAERGIGREGLSVDVTAVPIDVVVGLMAAGWKVIWH